MFNIEARYKCPVCLGPKMQKLKLGTDNNIVLDFCKRCGGIWFDYGEVKQLCSLQPNVLFNKIYLKKENYQMQCYLCHSFMDRNASKCEKCGWQNIIDCPICQKSMEITTYLDFHLDYCKTCKGVWFDNIELADIWNGKLNAFANKHLFKVKDSAFTDNNAATFFVDILSYDPGLVVYGAEAIGEFAIEASSGIISNVPEIAGACAEGIGELAGAVFEIIAEIIGSIFS
jgi:Zn-finger nucleic acid-binding protein